MRLRDLALDQGVIQPETGRLPDQRMRYYVCEEAVCKDSFAYLHCMGVRPRLARLLRAVFEGKHAPPMDSRYLKKATGVNPRPSTGEVHSYLQSLYDSVAETLPDDLVADFNNGNDDLDLDDDDASSLVITSGLSAKDDDVGRQQSHVRFLPPGSYYDQFKQYLALGNPSVSFPTFLAIWKQNFGHLLFRGRRQHAICATCTRHRLLIKTLPIAARNKQRLLYERHLAAQYEDRRVYWKIRSDSRAHAKHAESGHCGDDNKTLSLVIDSIDQQKFAWPRARFLLSKDFSTFNRPRLHCTAVIAHGWGVWIFVAHSDVQMCGSSTVEMLAYVLSELRDAGCQVHALNVHVQLDNTSTTNKNNVVFSWMGTCVSLGICRSMTASFLRVGHTHEEPSSCLVCSQVPWNSVY